MPKVGRDLRWGVEQRMAYIDTCLFWAGQINRADLTERFGISVPQASADLARYAAAAPSNSGYDSSRKAYVRMPDFSPLVGRPSADQVLSSMEAGVGGAVDSGTPWIEGMHAQAVLPALKRKISDDVLQGLMHAVRQTASVRIRYQSFSRPGPTLRWITPHAFATDGFRWHVRAHCPEHGDFRDFVLSRISLARGTAGPTAPAVADRVWSSFATLELAPNPRLAPGARRGLEMDYGMVKGVAKVRARVAFLYYIRISFGLDLDEGADPKRVQLVLRNAQEVRAAEERARAATRAELLSAVAADATIF